MLLLYAIFRCAIESYYVLTLKYAYKNVQVSKEFDQLAVICVISIEQFKVSTYAQFENTKFHTKHLKLVKTISKASTIHRQPFLACRHRTYKQHINLPYSRDKVFQRDKQPFPFDVVHSLVQVNQFHVAVAEDLPQKDAVDARDDLVGVAPTDLDRYRVVLVARGKPRQLIL